MPSKVRNIIVGTIGLMVLFAIGCVETALKYHGNKVSSVDVVSIGGVDSSAGTWKTFDLIVDYRFTQNGDVLQVSGQAELGQHYQMTYDRLRYMRMYLFFVDQDSRVVETVYFADFLTANTDETLTFSKSYKIPDGTVGISFGYSGAAAEMEARTIFYKLPLKK